MNRLKKHFIPIIEWFIILQPLLDFLTSLMVRFFDTPFTIGVIVRTVFVGLIGIYLLFFYNSNHKKLLLIFYIITCVYGIINISVSAVNYGLGTIIENSKMFFKMYYFVFVLLFFYAIYKKYGFVVKNKLLTVVFIEYTASIFISAVTKTSFVTYPYAEGYCGWFYAGNEVGAIVSALSVIALLYAVGIKNIFLKIAIGFLSAFSAVYIGTKVPFISFIGAILLITVFFAIKLIVKRDSASRKVLVQALALILTTIILFQLNSPIKLNNTTLANEHFDSHVTDKLEEEEEEENTDSLVTNKNSFGYRVFLLANWILSDRLITIAPAVSSYIEGDALQFLFGLGYEFETPSGKIYSALIEMDFMALLINHGFIGLILYFTPIIYFAVICIKKFFANIKTAFFEMETALAYTYSILITLGCAFLAGHVLIAPAVSIYLAIIIIKLFDTLNNSSEHCVSPNKEALS